MEHWGGMLRGLLFGPGWRGGTRGWAFSSWRRHLPQAGLLSATELVNKWTAAFEKEGIPEARESSEYIVAHVLGAKTFQSLRPALRRQPLTPGQLQCIQELSGRRLRRMPVQYILGEWDFQGLNLKMAPPVFIPRPETEELVEWVLEEVALRPRGAEAQGGPLILEVGCGSGAIALSLLSRLPQMSLLEVLEGTLPDVAGQGYPQPTVVTASTSVPFCLARPWPTEGKDVGLSLLFWPVVAWGLWSPGLASPSTCLPCNLHAFSEQSRAIAVDKGDAAVRLTRENTQRLRLQDRIQIVSLDVTLEGSWAHLLFWGPLDLIVSNPPYVFRQDMEQLAPEIRSYEDPAALDGGEKGMDVIECILDLAPRLLKDSGSIFLEVDPRHPELVSSWLQSRPDLSLNVVAVRRDFCGRPRFLHIRRSGAQGGCPVDVQPGPPPARVPR